jgi:Zn-dependent peptidase ImmA (M78 family)
MTLNIHGYEWLIVKTPTNENDDGYCDEDNRIIEIDESLEPEDELYTLLHEFGHAVLGETGFRHTGLSSDAEEIIVDQIAKELIRNFDIKIKAT